MNFRERFMALRGIMLVMFLTGFTTSVPSTLIPGLQTETFGHSTFMTAGALAAAKGVFGCILLPLLGSFTDVRGRRTALVIVTTLSIIPYVTLLIGSFWAYSLANIFVGLCDAVLTLLLSLTAEKTSKSPIRRTEAFAMVLCCLFLGMSTGPVVGIFMSPFGKSLDEKPPCNTPGGGACPPGTCGQFGTPPCSSSSSDVGGSSLNAGGSNSASAPSSIPKGQYCGASNNPAAPVSIQFDFTSRATMNVHLDIFHMAKTQCDGEAWSVDASTGALTIPGTTSTSGCLHDALSKFGLGLEAVYDQAKDVVAVRMTDPTAHFKLSQSACPSGSESGRPAPSTSAGEDSDTKSSADSSTVAVSRPSGGGGEFSASTSSSSGGVTTATPNGKYCGSWMLMNSVELNFISSSVVNVDFTIFGTQYHCLGEAWTLAHSASDAITIPGSVSGCFNTTLAKYGMNFTATYSPSTNTIAATVTSPDADIKMTPSGCKSSETAADAVPRAVSHSSAGRNIFDSLSGGSTSSILPEEGPAIPTGHYCGSWHTGGYTLYAQFVFTSSTTLNAHLNIFGMTQAHCNAEVWSFSHPRNGSLAIPGATSPGGCLVKALSTFDMTLNAVYHRGTNTVNVITTNPSATIKLTPADCGEGSSGGGSAGGGGADETPPCNTPGGPICGGFKPWNPVFIFCTALQVLTAGLSFLLFYTSCCGSRGSESERQEEPAAESPLLGNEAPQEGKATQVSDDAPFIRTTNSDTVQEGGDHPDTPDREDARQNYGATTTTATTTAKMTSLVLNKNLRLVVFIIFGSSLAESVMEQLLLPYLAKDLDFTPMQMGVVMAITGMMSIKGLLGLTPCLKKHFGIKNTLAIGLVAQSIVVLFYAFARVAWLVQTATTITAFGRMALPCALALAVSSAGHGKNSSTGTILGMATASRMLAKGITPLAFGAIMNTAHGTEVPGLAFLCAAVCCLVAAAVVPWVRQ